MNFTGEHSLVKAATQGDSRSFAQLAAKYQKRVRAMGMSFFKNTSDTDDFMQEVFLKAYTSLATFRYESKFSTWLFRIAYNLAVNSINRRKQYASLSEEDLILDESAGPEESVLRNITAETIRTLLKEIPSQQAICLDMYFFYNMSYSEISEVVNMPVNTIKSHVFRAKKILKTKLESEKGEH